MNNNLMQEIIYLTGFLCLSLLCFVVVFLFAAGLVKILNNRLVHNVKTLHSNKEIKKALEARRAARNEVKK